MLRRCGITLPLVLAFAAHLSGCVRIEFPVSLVQAVSLDGRGLAYTPPAEDRATAMWEDVCAAREMFQADPANEEAIIWYGRRLAYVGHHRAAIDIYRAGLDFHPDSFRIRRHLGHRLITVRELDRAISVLSRAAVLLEGVPDEVEPDGQPNALDQPRSTTHFNIWYHLALAKYLARDFTGAAEAWRKCLDVSANDDAIVAASYWLFLSLLQIGDSEAAGRILDGIDEEMDVIENLAYHKLLLLFQGREDTDDLLAEAEAVDLDLATVGYGVGMHMLVDGDAEGASQLWERVIEETNWAAFGHIAAEAELAADKPATANGTPR